MTQPARSADPPARAPKRCILRRVSRDLVGIGLSPGGLSQALDRTAGRLEPRRCDLAILASLAAICRQTDKNFADFLRQKLALHPVSA
jgi:hypothetical protein